MWKEVVNMEKEDTQEWLINIEKLGYIDCQSS